jgi:transposase
MIDVSPSAGIDVGSTWLDLGFHPCAKPSAKPIRARNSDAGIETIIAALRQRGAGKVALEAIGGYARRLVTALIEAGLSVFVVNPRRIKAFRDAEGLIAKTDKLDAGLIARFAHAMVHELRPLADAEHAILKALSTRRRQLTESIAIEKTRLKQAFDPLIVESCREMIAILEDKRQRIEADLDRRIDAQDRMARRRATLSSIPGVGARISALLVVEMPELGAIDRKAAASLAGLAPHPSQSGLARGRNAISGGRPCVRAAFYMAALVATRHHPKFKQIYLDLRAAGKPAKVALVAVARRIVTLANALVRDDISFNNAAFA